MFRGHGYGCDHGRDGKMKMCGVSGRCEECQDSDRVCVWCVWCVWERESVGRQKARVGKEGMEEGEEEKARSRVEASARRHQNQT